MNICAQSCRVQHVAAIIVRRYIVLYYNCHLVDKHAVYSFSGMRIARSTSNTTTQDSIHHQGCGIYLSQIVMKTSANKIFEIYSYDDIVKPRLGD